jgi:hypothetical protein
MLLSHWILKCIDISKDYAFTSHMDSCHASVQAQVSNDECTTRYYRSCDVSETLSVFRDYKQALPDMKLNSPCAINSFAVVGTALLISASHTFQPAGKSQMTKW